MVRSKFGLDQVDDTQEQSTDPIPTAVDETPKQVVIPKQLTAREKPKIKRPKPSRAGGSSQASTEGFPDRSGATKRRKPGPKPTEPQTRMSMTGPVRVFDDFRSYADARGGPLWKSLEHLLERAGDPDDENTENT